MALSRLALKMKDCTLPELGAFLQDAVRTNGLAATRMLLKGGADPNFPLVAAMSASKGYAHILRLLIKHGLDLTHSGEELMLMSVENGRSECIEVLHAGGVRVDFENDQPLFNAVEWNHVNTTKTILSLGADPNGRAGNIFATACAVGSFALIYTMVRFGADPNVSGKPIEFALRRRNISIVTFLVNNGADLSAASLTHLDDVTGSFLKVMMNRTRVTRLQVAVTNSFHRHEFKWQALAIPANLTLTGMARLRRQAKLFGINTTGLTKRQICRDLALTCYPSIKRKPSANDGTDLSGTSLAQLPTWQLMEINGKFWNVFDLFKLLELDKFFDPFTFEPLPKNLVLDRRQFLAETLMATRYKEIDILDGVRNNPIPCPRSILRGQLMELVWEKLLYPPPMEVVLEADDESLDDMLIKLSLLTSGSHAYPMITPRAMANVRIQSGIEKTSTFVQLLSSILRPDDEMRSTRAQLLSIVLRHAASSEDQGNAEEDLFSFMTDEPPTTFHFGYDEDDYYF